MQHVEKWYLSRCRCLSFQNDGRVEAGGNDPTMTPPTSRPFHSGSPIIPAFGIPPVCKHWWCPQGTASTSPLGSHSSPPEINKRFEMQDHKCEHNTCIACLRTVFALLSRALTYLLFSFTAISQSEITESRSSNWSWAAALGCFVLQELVFEIIQRITPVLMEGGQVYLLVCRTLFYRFCVAFNCQLVPVQMSTLSWYSAKWWHQKYLPPLKYLFPRFLAATACSKGSVGPSGISSISTSSFRINNHLLAHFPLSKPLLWQLLGLASSPLSQLLLFLLSPSCPSSSSPHLPG